ncbi:MAG: ATP synthase F0 subunit C [Candidatus Aminicenantes bacterium]|nr:MAG: ATP synthase F0 subunit C [Candidatus Aminicenantes bacterium]
MKRKFMLVIFLTLILSFSISLSAQEAGETGQKKVEDATPLFLWTIIIAIMGLTLAAIGGAWSQSKALRTASENIGRNPAAADAIRGILIIGLALIESLVIYVLLIDFIIIGTWGKYTF